ncbi:MAG TPA: DUF4232 domain-containing protein [Trebonia sp.]|jgi:hypothetical protein|nr:DUF4232 domain-containing protein [Trebonia sp.]
MNKTVRRLTAAGAALAALAGGSAVWATSSSAAAAAPGSIGRCGAGQLSVWLNASSENGAAGSTYYNLDFTNTSGTECHLYGYPGVSVIGANGGQLGASAQRNSVIPARYVNIGPGQTAHAVLRYADVQVTSGCKPAAGAFLKVYPPDEKGSRLAFFSLPSCTTGAGYLQIERVQPGV